MARIKLAAAKDLPKPGDKKDFVAFGEGDDALKILLSNVKGKIHATSAKCTHYGAPLANGVLTGDGRIICPWHGACFHVNNGDIEDAPALDSLLSFPTEIDSNGDLYVEAEEEQLKGKPGRPVTCSGQVKKDGNGFVIVGGGSAAINAIESARKNGYLGKITVLTAEPYGPLDRTKLSKALIGDAKELIWRSPAHLENVLKVDLRTGVQAESIDLKASAVKVSSGDAVPYDYLLLATGGKPKRLPLPGAKEGELKGVHIVRTVPDVQEVLNSLGDKKDKDVVIIGSSFIGMEVAIAISGQKLAKSVSVVGMEDTPLSGILGPEIGSGLQSTQADSNGIKFYMKAGVESIQGEGGKASGVQIKDKGGKAVELKADVVVMGVGAAPATDYIKQSQGFPELQKDGSVLCDSTLRIENLANGVSNVFAAGDIATWPSFDGKGHQRIEHWNVAGNQGRAVGQTVAELDAGKADKAKGGRKYEKVPIFWSALGGQLRYVSDGNPGEHDDTHLDGNPAEGKFVKYYGRGGKVAAVASMGRDPIMAHSSELMRIGKMPSFADVKNGKDPLSVALGAQA
ncbi:unnamed protein product [Parajaminaea phylloscopi]